jgi:hypothetical protein
MVAELVGRISTTGSRVFDGPRALRLRSVQWVLQVALLTVGVEQMGAFLLVAAVVPLALEFPLGSLSTPRGRLVGHAARFLGVACLGIAPSHLVVGPSTLLAGAIQSALVFVAAFVLSRDVVPVLGRLAR